MLLNITLAERKLSIATQGFSYSETASPDAVCILSVDGSKLIKFTNSFLTACRKSRVKAHPHMLRHSSASHLVMQGVDLPSIKELLGHPQISTIMIYAHLSSQHIADLPLIIGP
jgi:site-specific recombinase XerC